MSRGWGPAGGEVASGKGMRKQGLQRIRRLGRYAGPYRARLILAIVAMFGVLGCTLALPLLMKTAIDSAILPGDTRLLVLIAAVVIAIGIVGIALSRVETYFTGWVGERILNDLRTDLFQHMQGLSMGYFERQRTGVLISRLTNDVEALQQLVTDGLTSTVRNILTLVVAGGILLVLDFRLALATIIVFPLMAVLTFVFRGQSAKAYGQMRSRLALVTAALQEDLNGIRVIQAYRRESGSRAQIAVLNESYREANRTTVTSSGWYFPTVEFLAAVATCIVFGYGGYLYVDGTIEIGVLVAFIGYLASFFDPVQQLSQVYNTFLAGSAALDKIFDVMDDEPTLVDAPDAQALPHLIGAVRFEDVRFGYNPERPVRRWRSSATRAPASRRSSSCSRASTTRRRGASPSTATTCARSRSRRCAPRSPWCRRRASCSTARSTRTSPSAARPRRAPRSRPPRARWAPIASSRSCRAATTKRSASAAAGSRSASAS